MIPIQFNKAYAETVLTGILYAGVFSQGPAALQVAAKLRGLDLKELEAKHSEHKEAQDETLNRDIHDAIEYMSLLTFKVADRQYDAEFEPDVDAVLQRTEDGTTVIPVRGFKGGPNVGDGAPGRK